MGISSASCDPLPWKRGKVVRRSLRQYSSSSSWSMICMKEISRCDDLTFFSHKYTIYFLVQWLGKIRTSHQFTCVLKIIRKVQDGWFSLTGSQITSPPQQHKHAYIPLDYHSQLSCSPAAHSFANDVPPCDEKSSTWTTNQTVGLLEALHHRQASDRNTFIVYM